MAESDGGHTQLSNDLVDCVRQCVREELSRRNSGEQSLIHRTRQLISSSVSSISRDLSNANSNDSNRGIAMQVRSNVSAGQPMQVQSSIASGIKRPPSVPGHNWRSRKKSTGLCKAPKTVVKSVYLLEESDVPEEEYSLLDDMILLKGQCELPPNFDEKQIRNELVSLFVTKFPYISAADFDFVKRERNTVSKPIVKESHKWDFKHVKNLCGNGRLYVRLNLNSELVLRDIMDDIDPTIATPSSPVPQTSTSNEEHATTSSSGPVIAATRSSTLISNDVEYLSTVFPDTQREVVRETVLAHQDIDSAAAALCDGELENEKSDGGKCKTVNDILKSVRSSMKSHALAEKVKVDREDLLMDILHYYKSPDFDPTLPIKLQVRGEPAVDTGGVLRQVFTEFFLDVSHGTTNFRLFTGPECRLSPVYSSEHILTGIFEILGKVIAHSIIQGGPGFPYLAPGIFWYVATGDLGEAMARSSFVDIADAELAGIVAMVSTCRVPHNLVLVFHCKYIYVLLKERKNYYNYCFMVSTLSKIS